MKRKVLASILCLVFLFSMTGMALGAPKNGLYVKGHRYELTLSKGDAAYLKFLADLKAVAWDWTKVIIVNNNEFADYQEAIDEGSISDVLGGDAEAQIGVTLPTSVIPVANNGTEGPSEPVGDTVVEDIVYESTADLSTTSVSVANGTAEAAAIALLQNTVAVTGTKGESGNAAIAWTIAEYNATTAGNYTATGVLTLPVGWTGTAADVSATVTVQDAIPPAYASTAALTTTSVSVANGTAEADAIAKLQTSVGVNGTKGETGSAAITWSISGYDAAAAGDYTATGVLTLPEGWTGSADDVSATVTVQDAIPPAYASTAALTTTSVSVANGTAEAAAIALLQGSIAVTGTKGETGTASIAWSISGYDAAAAGDYTATGVLTLPEGWTGSADDVTATVTVEAPLPPAYESTAALTTASISVPNETAEADAIALLQTSVEVTSTKGETGSAAIAWTIAGYNAIAAGDYTATGVLTLPEGWTGSADDVTATVTVEAPLPPAYASTAALTTTSVSVENGTPEADAKALLQASVTVTSTKGETGSAAIAWTIAGYNAETAGDYTATGVLTLPTEWTGSAPNVSAKVTVEAPAGFSTAIEVIQNAIANFKPVNAEGKFGGEVLKVKVVGDVTVNKCDFYKADTWIKANKTQQSKMKVNITPQVQTSDKDVTTPNFPFAEIISGVGVGANAVASGVLTQDENYYYIRLTNAECPTSVLNIIDAAGNVSSGTKMNFTEQKANCTIKVSKATGLVESVYDVTITGKTNVTKSTLNLANGTYNNTFWNKDGPITYSY